MKRLTTSAAFLVVFAATSAAFALTATVDFESQPVGTTYGGSSGNSPGDLIFTEDNIDVRLRNFGPSFSQAQIGGFTNSAFPTTPVTISNISLEFDFANVGFPVSEVTFEYADFGGTERLGVNGTEVSLARLFLAPPTIGGAMITVTESPVSGGVMGLVTITGAIDTVLVGGQEFGMDNLVAVGVPEPTTVALLAFGLLCTPRRPR